MRILVLEDNAKMCDLYRMYLQEYDTTVVQNAEDAWCALSNGAFDLLIVDVRLSDIDGIDFLEQAFLTYPRIPVIIVTGYTDEHAIEYAEEHPDVWRLEKPIERQELLSLIKIATSLNTQKIPNDQRRFFQRLVYANRLSINQLSDSYKVEMK